MTVRKGELWYYKAIEVLSKRVDINKVQYHGVVAVKADCGDTVETCGLFEIKDCDIYKLDSSLKKYKCLSKGIAYVTCHKELKGYKNCVLFHLRRIGG